MAGYIDGESKHIVDGILSMSRSLFNRGKVAATEQSAAHFILSGCACRELLWLFHWNLNLLLSIHPPLCHGACQTTINLPEHIWIWWFQLGGNNEKCNYENIRAVTLSFPVTIRALHAVMFTGFSISFPNYMSEQKLDIFNHSKRAARSNAHKAKFHRNSCLTQIFV